MPQNGKTFSKTIPDFGAPGRPPVLLLVRALLPILPVLQPHHGRMPAEQVGSVCRLHLVPLEQWRRRAKMWRGRPLDSGGGGDATCGARRWVEVQQDDAPLWVRAGWRCGAGGRGSGHAGNDGGWNGNGGSGGHWLLPGLCGHGHTGTGGGWDGSGGSGGHCPVPGGRGHGNGHGRSGRAGRRATEQRASSGGRDCGAGGRADCHRARVVAGLAGCI